jgi:hypothetical protein
MPTPKATAKSSLSKNVKTAPPLNKEKFNKALKTITDARIALNSLKVPRRIASAGPTRQELDSMAKKLGLDPTVLEQESARKNEEMLRIAKKQQENAAEKSPSVQKLLKGLLPVANVATESGPVEQFFIFTPLEIEATQGLTGDGYEAHDGEGNSFAKFRLEKSSGSGTETLSFIFVWYSPGLYTYISVDAYLIMNGYAKAVAKGGYGFDLPFTFLNIVPTLSILDESANPFSFTVSDQESAVELTAWPNNPGFYQHSVAVSTNVARLVQMHVGPIGVPLNSIVFIEVNVDVIYSVEKDNGGSIDADFSSNAYNITAPNVIVTQW